MMNVARPTETLSRIERLFARAFTPGDRVAVVEARG
jgi:hypothetical protein